MTFQRASALFENFGDAAVGESIRSINRQRWLADDEGRRLSAHASKVIAEAKGQARAEGFAEGVAMAEAQAQRDLELQMAAVAAALVDARSNRTDRDAEAAKAVRKTLSALVRALFPKFAETAVVEEVLTIVEAELLEAPELEPVVEMRPEIVERAAAAFAAADIDARISAASDLEPGGARIRWRGGFDQIDPTSAIERALAIIDAHAADAARHQHSLEETGYE